MASVSNIVVAAVVAEVPLPGASALRFLEKFDVCDEGALMESTTNKKGVTGANKPKLTKNLIAIMGDFENFRGVPGHRLSFLTTQLAHFGVNGVPLYHSIRILEEALGAKNPWTKREDGIIVLTEEGKNHKGNLAKLHSYDRDLRQQLIVERRKQWNRFLYGDDNDPYSSDFECPPNLEACPLLQNCYDEYCKGKKGEQNPPLEQFWKHCREEVVTFFEACKDANAEGVKSFAFPFSLDACVECPIVMGYQNPVIHAGETALHVAAAFGHVKVIDALVREMRFPVDRLNKDGTTPLSYAVGWEEVDAVEALLNAGATATEKILKQALREEDNKAYDRFVKSMVDEQFQSLDAKAGKERTDQINDLIQRCKRLQHSCEKQDKIIKLLEEAKKAQAQKA